MLGEKLDLTMCHILIGTILTIAGLVFLSWVSCNLCPRKLRKLPPTLAAFVFLVFGGYAAVNVQVKKCGEEDTVARLLNKNQQIVALVPCSCPCCSE